MRRETMLKRKSLSTSSDVTKKQNDVTKKKRKSLFLNTHEFRQTTNPPPPEYGGECSGLRAPPLQASTPANQAGGQQLNIRRRRRGKCKLTFNNNKEEKDESESREGKHPNLPLASPGRQGLEVDGSFCVSDSLQDISSGLLGGDVINNLDVLHSETIPAHGDDVIIDDVTDDVIKGVTVSAKEVVDKVQDSSTSDGNGLQNMLPKSPATRPATEVTLPDDSLLNCFNSSIDVSFNQLSAHSTSLCVLGQSSLKDDEMFADLELTKIAVSTKQQQQQQQKDEEKPTFYGLPMEVKGLFVKHRGISELYEWQDECLKLKAIDERRNLVYSLPTSGGKTLVAELLLLKELVVRKKNVVLVLPYVSIVQEKVRGLSPFAVDLNFHIEEYAASKGSIPPKRRKTKKSVYIATIEKANAIVNSFISEQRSEELGLVVVDELHMVGEGGGRGSLLEILLTKIMFKCTGTQIVGMSATLGNMGDVQKFLKAEIYYNDFRPVELTEYVKVDDMVYRIDPKAKTDDELLVFTRKIVYPKGLNPTLKSRDPDQLLSLVVEVIPQYSCLVFCPTKKNCENVAVMLARSLPKHILNVRQAERNSLLEIIHKATSGVCKVLSETVPYGIAYHHSGLTGDERELIEEAYTAGVLSLLCCTSTLAAGVNLPARRVILRSPYVGNKFLSRSQYKQMVGRAGRAGIDSTGESVVIVQQKDKVKSRGLFDGPMPTCESSLIYQEGKGLRELILSLLGLDICSCVDEIENFLQLTLFHIQQSNNNNSSNNKAFKDGTEWIQKELEHLKKLGLISDNLRKDGVSILRTTSLGNATLKSCLNLDLAPFVHAEMTRALEGVVLANELHLMYLVTPLDLVSAVQVDWMLFYNIVDRLNEVELKACQLVGITRDVLLRKGTGQRVSRASCNEFVYKRFYLTLIIRDIVCQRTLWGVADKFAQSRGFLQSLYSSMMSFMSNMIHFCEEINTLWAFKLLFQALATHVVNTKNVEIALLMEIPGVKQARAMQLFKGGYHTLQHVAHADPKVLSRDIDNLSRRQSEQVVFSAKMVLQEKIESLREEADEIAVVPVVVAGES